MRTISTSNLNTPLSTTLAPTATVTTITPTTHKLWNSPIPYLFGGLAAMLGLIAFALLILAFSYKRRMGQWQNQDGSNHRDLEKESDTEKKEAVKVYEEKILVIMAGDENPTFLATPVCPKSLSFGVGIGNQFDKQLGDPKVCDKCEKEIDNNHVVVAVAEGASSTQENQTYQETQLQQN
ncbi:hypothetical protein RIF29_27301 [Crotalaria pallida]|uniref:Uncharacterized protein n=1 Tax=Crotalaria pallida TaxID=3830 RepID=A0AAN9EPR7_CROPI